MNIHPIFVHFPIAFLTVYAVAELLRFKKLTSQQWWWNTKAIMLLVGVLGGIAALITGNMAEAIVGPSALVEMHSTYAFITIVIFAIILFAYKIRACELFLPQFVARPIVTHIFRVVSPIARFIFMIAPALALVGLITVTIAGALGGAIAYGPDVDPVVKVVYSLLIK